MDAISNLTPRPLAVPAVREADGEAAAQPSGSPQKVVRDEYVPEKKREPYGRYWLGKDEDGSPKIYFDGPEMAENTLPEPPGAEDPGEGKEPGLPAAPSGGNRKPERCTANTDAVDRAVKKLKEKKEELERQAGQETDEAKKKELERELSQVEEELRRKDNDAYRRQHASYTFTEERNGG